MDYERDEKGRFQPGNPGSPGRPPKATEDSILDAFKRALTEEELDAIAQQIVKQSRQGQTKSLRVLLEYLIGTPVQRNRVDVSADMIELLRNWRSGDKDGKEST